MRRINNEDRKAAAARAAARAAAAVKSGMAQQLAKPAAPRTAGAAYGVPAAPNYFGAPNWAFSPIIPKFVDSLPGLGAANASTLGPNNYIPIAVKDTTTFPGSDYYTIELGEYQQQFHSSLGPTTLRGYRDVNGATPADQLNHYLGPVIVAERGTPVRIKFINNLPTGTTSGLTGNGGLLFIPTDTSYMGAGLGPDRVSSYSQNRADLHLHGGNSPWISDGTTHQWVTPAGEATTPYLKGVSFQNVPDMVGATGSGKPIENPLPGDGMGSYYWTNQQSARLLFYHDHAYGITRLNVYAGEAAGYLIHDTTEDGLIASGILPNQGGGVYNWGIPLIIQDKTFVDPTTIATTDPTWVWLNTNGSLWYPHVYMPNQNPADQNGANAFGRWDYGMWFWPPLTATELVHADVSCASLGLTDPVLYPPGSRCPGTPNPSGVPEAFMDTPIVNGAAYPYVPVGRDPYRFRILNATNDRGLNLQLYYAATAAGVVCKGPGAPAASLCTEVSMVSAMPHPTVPPPVPEVPPDADDLLQCAAAAVPDPVTGLPPNCWPSTWPTDGRDGGVPDPTTAGPQLYQLGTESGFLPQLVAIPSTPVGYDYNRRSITVLNVITKGLFLMPAERADVVIDFSSVPDGSTLILYNDSPAPVPAFDTRLDYYTGDPDQSATGDNTGGAPTTLAGFGPNTRTIMQFRVSGGSGTAFNVAALQAALPAAYAASQEPPVVPESAFNLAYGSAYPDNYARIQHTSMTFTGGTGNCPPPNGCPMLSKAIHELFEQNYGRMNALLGVELPLTSYRIQTTLPYSYIDPPTEIVQTLTPQIWKITHNGVDTHGIHFHLFDVQVINRVGWDGEVKPPDANEVGWKDTVRMNPLEDVIVALRPMGQTLPWPIPDSTRTMDVTMPENAIENGLTGFLGIAPDNNAVPNLVNKKINFGGEYVWHCHILGHEENDMMRPVVYQIVPLEAPTNLVAAQTGGTQVTLTFADHSASETGFSIEKATNPGFSPLLATISVPPNPTLITGPAGAPTTYVDNSVTTGNYYYRAYATKNTVYDGVDSIVGIRTAPVSAADQRTQSLYSNPATVQVVNTAAPVITRTTGTGSAPNLTLVLTWSGPPTATFSVQRSANSAFTPATTLACTVSPCTDTPLAAGTYFYRVGNTLAVPTNWSASVVVGPPAAPSALSAALNGTTGVRLTWTDNAPSVPTPPNFVAENGFTVLRTNPDATVSAFAVLAHSGTGTTTFDNTPPAPGTYSYRVRANNVFGSSALSNAASITR